MMHGTGMESPGLRPRHDSAHSDSRPPAIWRWLLLAALLAACGPAAPPAPVADRPPDAERQAPTSIPGKPLRAALTNEPAAIAGKFGGGRSGFQQYAELFGAQLVRYDYQRNPVAQLAQEVPALDKGTWRTASDGRMETIYRLRPTTTWHDGAAFTAEDVIFTWRAVMNPALPASDREPERYIDSMEAPDPHTVLIRWKEPYIYANAYETAPLARHVLEPLLQRDPQAFVNASYWTNEWIGLGPYQLADWVQGSHLKGRSFANYVLGKPRVEEVFVYFISDANQAVARVLAGNIDLTMGSLIKIEEGVLLRDQWEARGEGRIATTPASIRMGDIQFRDAQAPLARDVRVRRALAYALDRQLMVDTLHYGLTMVAHTWIPPDNPAVYAADTVIAKYPYDPGRAAELLAEAGWTKGSDGVQRSTRGDRLDLGVRSLDGAQYVKEAQVAAELWQSVGFAVELEFYSRAKQNDREYRSRFAGIAFGSPNAEPGTMLRWSSREMATESNGWRGQNRGAYAKPDVDQLIGSFFSTIDPARRMDTLVYLLRLTSEDLPSLTLYYPVDVFAIRSGLQGVVPSKPGDGWEVFNAHLLYWDR